MKNLFYFAIIVLMAISCQKPPKEGVQVETKGKNKDVQLIFQSPAFKEALTITNIPDKNKGSIFFRTAEGKTWLRNNPVTSMRDSAGYHAEWKLDNRKVSIKIQKKEQDFEVQLSAKPNDDILGWGFNLEAKKGEYFTGLFERVVDGNQQKSWEEGITEGLNLRGQEVDMIIKPTLSLYAPFYVSSRGYGLFVKGTWPGHYDMCKEADNRVQISFDGPELNFKLYTSEDPMEIVKAHTMDAGPQWMPPKWAFSHWRWRDNNGNEETYYDGTPVDAPYNSMLVEDILMLDALDIPVGLYWVDRPWTKGPEGYVDFEWDKERFPYPEKMIQWLASKNIEFMLWIAPWVKGDMAETAIEKGYNMPKKEGDWAENRELVDFTNPEAKKWWQEEGLKKVLKQGVKGFKLDRSEEIVPSSRDCKVHDGRTCREIRNAYPVEYVKATYEAAKEVHGDDFVCLPRAGYTGSQKYGIFWGGDIAAPQEGLRAAIIALQRSAVMGYPIWGSDIGGYWGAEFDREVLARWLAFGCFSPIMEVGPTRNKGLWDLNDEPTYDPQLMATWRLYATLHTNLMDYSYKYAKEAHENGTPIARPLSIAYPEQEKAKKDWQTYLYGPDILISAIWEKGKTKHSLYLPKGEKWVDAWNKDKVYKGGKTIEVDAPMYKIPIFIRQGASVELGDLNALYQESLEIAKEQPDMKTLEKQANFQASQ
jgi:alpha-glucosidase (family GH31 glycosyl hydrolase)